MKATRSFRTADLVVVHGFGLFRCLSCGEDVRTTDGSKGCPWHCGRPCGPVNTQKPCGCYVQVDGPQVCEHAS